MIKKINQQEVEICCSGNCPSVKFENGRILITDDFGTTIDLSPEESQFLTEAAKKVIEWNK